MAPIPVYSSDNFSLFISQKENTTSIKMQLHISILYTSDFPHTLFFLKEKLPGVLNTKCFNERNIPFHHEVTQTEIGHLFEHVLLEYLCREKLSRGNKSIVFNGLTNWNWHQDPKGVFHITIDVGLEDKEIFENALEKSIFLIESLIREGEVQKNNLEETNSLSLPTTS
ncbi:MAG: hypothetical protein HYT08_03290 [Candidatus Levybacteria bacterium]|nr:hypothetical protein [Candidatus Levybacteria bacterium]